MAVILLFIDGLGWGGTDPAVNSQHAYGGELFRLPRLPGEGDDPVPLPRGGWARPVDAVLGVAGLPQSASGQTTLLSGVNAQAAIGQHLTGFPNEALRAILLEHSVLRQLTRLGRRACFLNAFRPRFFEFPRERQLHFSATTVANLAADLPFFGLDDIAAGRSIYQEFTNAELQALGFDVPTLAPDDAGRVLGRAAAHYDFVLFEYFQSDKAGHGGAFARACDELAKLDAFLAAALDAMPQGTLLVVCSDHGNLEDMTTRRHTANPVPLMAWGPGAREFAAPLARLDEVTGAIVARLR